MRQLIAYSAVVAALVFGGGLAVAATQAEPLPDGCQYGVPSDVMQGNWACIYYQGEVVCCPF